VCQAEDKNDRYYPDLVALLNALSDSVSRMAPQFSKSSGSPLSFLETLACVYLACGGLPHEPLLKGEKKGSFYPRLAHVRNELLLAWTGTDNDVPRIRTARATAR
jgi:hypothetical protein